MFIKKSTRSISLLLLTLLCFSLMGFTNNAEAATQKPNVSAHAYVIMDSNSGEILHSQDPYKKIYPASTAKMMTALVAIENTSLSKQITVKQSVLSKVPSDASQAGLKAGSTYKLEELLNMLLVSSAADAADTIAESVAGSTTEFAKLMNQKAKNLGMNSTNFDNAIGMDGRRFPNTYSSANDIAKLTRAAMKNTTIRNIVSKPTYTIRNFSNGSSKTINNTNRFLRGQWYPKDLYTVIGTKTGTTDAAGYVLSSTAIDKNGREIICAFFGNATTAKRYENTEALLTYTFKNLNYGWSQKDGKWYYYDKSGTIKTGWVKDKESWYYLRSTGEMATGWVKYDGTWYYLRSTGEMATGWVKHDGIWYYLRSAGEMATGWVKHDGTWYYLRSTGEMASGWVKHDGIWYYLRSTGEMATGWVKHDGIWYYLRSTGEMATGWVKHDGTWYYLRSTGEMATNTNIDGWNIDDNGVATLIKYI